MQAEEYLKTVRADVAALHVGRPRQEKEDVEEDAFSLVPPQAQEVRKTGFDGIGSSQHRGAVTLSMWTVQSKIETFGLVVV